MDRLEQLKQKYQSVLAFIQRGGILLDHLHVQDDKLYMKGRAASEALKNRVWDKIKEVDPSL